MLKILSTAVVCFWVLTGAAFGENLSGTYTLSSQGTTLTLTLKQDAQGKIKGTLVSTTGARFQIEGMTQDGVGVGTCMGNQGGSYFEAHPKGNQLLLALIEPDANKNPDYNRVKHLMFTRKGGAVPDPRSPQASPGQQGRQPQPGPPASPGTGGLAALSKNEVSDPSWGFKFSLPKGWKAEKGPKGAVLGHDTIPGMIWVFPHTASSLQEIQAQMQHGLEEEDIHLRLASPIQSLGSNVLAGTFSGLYQGQQVKARGLATLAPNGGGALIIAMTVPNKFGADLSNTADKVAGSMQYSPSVGSAGLGGTGGGSVPSSSGGSLMRQMAGVYYSFSSAGVGYSGGTERKVTLCPNGTYYTATESGYSGGAGTAGAWGTASQGGGRGTWRIEGNLQQGTIVTVDSGGKATTYRYQRCGSDCVYFGNNKFAYAGPANCP